MHVASINFIERETMWPVSACKTEENLLSYLVRSQTRTVTVIPQRYISVARPAMLCTVYIVAYSTRFIHTCTPSRGLAQGKSLH